MYSVRGRRDSHPEISKDRYSPESHEDPASISLLKCSLSWGNASSEPWRAADARTRTGALSSGVRDGVSLPVEPGKPEPTQNRTGSVLATQPLLGPRAHGITSTRPPDLPAQTAAALACCSRPPLPRRLRTAPSPFRRPKMPPCCSHPQLASAQTCVGAQRRAGGGRKGRREGEERLG